MKDNTYIIPAIEFYIVVPNSEVGQFNSVDDAEEKINSNECILIPFSQVDGLTIREITNITKFSSGFMVCAVNHLEFEEKCVHYDINDIQSVLFFPKREDLSEFLNKRIDKIVEEAYESNYRKANDRERQVYNSFFEKYQDGDYQKTKERVNKLLGKSRR